MGGFNAKIENGRKRELYEIVGLELAMSEEIHRYMLEIPLNL